MSKKHVIDTNSAEFKARAEVRRRTWSFTRYTNLDDMKTAEYRYWATQPVHVKVATISDMTTDAYAMKGIHVQRLQRPHRTPE